MKYLHNTAVKFHGNLTSSRCVIDSHWVVKITDWGLHDFKAGQEKVNLRTRKMYTGEWILLQLSTSQYDQLPVGLIAQLVEHFTGVPEVMGSDLA